MASTPTITRAQRRRAKRSAQTSAELWALPQAQALSQLLRATSQNFAADVGQTKSYAASVRANALSQVNPLRAALQPILDQQRGDQATSAARLAAIGTGGSDYAASAAREAQAADARLSGTQAGAVTELNSRAADAGAGAQFAIQGLTTRRAADEAKIGDQLAGLAQQKGLTAKKSYQDALDALATQGIQIRGQDLTYKAAAGSLTERSRHDRALEDAANRRADAAARTGGKPKTLSPGDASKAVDKINYAVTKISQLERNPKLSSTAIRQQLIQGVNVPAGTDPKTGQKLAAVKIDPVPKDFVNAAYDLVKLGALSRPNRIALIHQRRIPRSAIPKGWLGQVRRPPAAAQGILGQIGGFANALSHAAR